MKNPITSDLFINKFRFILYELNFIIKGSLFIRVVNDQIIQTIFPFKISPIYIDINIGMFSIYQRLMKFQLKEGNYKFGDIIDRQYEVYGIGKVESSFTLLIKDFYHKMVPQFKMVNNLEELIKFKSRLQAKSKIKIMPEMFETYLKLNNFQEALNTQEFILKQEKKGILIIKKSIKDNEGIYTMDSITKLEETIYDTERNINAITCNDTEYLNNIISSARRNSKELLSSYGILI